MALFYVVGPRSLVEIDCPDDGGNKHLWKVGKYLQVYKVQQPRRQFPSYTPP
jgi:hypothetical protein